MSGTELTIVSLGSDPVPEGLSAEDGWRVVRAGSSAGRGERLNALVSGVESEFVTVSEALASAADLKRAVRVLRDSPDSVGVLLAAPGGRLSDAWSRYPGRVASLAVSPGSESLVLRGRANRAERPFQDVERPLWDFVIRAAAAGQRVAAVPSPSVRAAETQNDEPLRSLAPPAPGRSSQWLADHLEAFDLARCDCRVGSRPDAVAVKAGLWQIHGFLDESHALAQGIEGEGQHRSGDHWHAIMHRREPDESNAKYWYRHVGRSPIFPELGRWAAEILESSGDAGERWSERLLAGGWDPFAFVDFCAEARRRSDARLALVAARIQQAEMDLLLRQSFADATGEFGV